MFCWGDYQPINCAGFHCLYSKSRTLFPKPHNHVTPCSVLTTGTLLVSCSWLTCKYLSDISLNSISHISSLQARTGLLTPSINCKYLTPVFLKVKQQLADISHRQLPQPCQRNWQLWAWLPASTVSVSISCRQHTKTCRRRELLQCRLSSFK